MSELENRILEKIKSRKEKADAEQTRKQMEKTQAHLDREASRTKFDAAFRETIKPTVDHLVSWLERNGQKVKRGAPSTPSTIELIFELPGKSIVEAPILTIMPSHDLKSVELHGFFGVLVKGKNEFDSPSMPIEDLKADAFRAEIMRFLDKALS